MTILTIDEFYCKNAVKFKKHAANKSDQWPFQVIFFEVSHFTSYIYIYQFHSFNNGSYQRNLFVLVLTAVNSHMRFCLCLSLPAC